MAKRFLPLAAIALVLSGLAACTDPTAPAATQPTHHVAPQSSAGTLIGSEG